MKLLSIQLQMSQRNKDGDALNGKGNPSVDNTCISPGCRWDTKTEWHITYKRGVWFGLEAARAQEVPITRPAGCQLGCRLQG